MIAAEEWHRYQEDYMRYGVDLTPQKPYVRRKKKEKASALRATAKEKTTLLVLIAAAGVCCIMIIFFQACASRINYDVYTLNQEINSLSVEIGNLTAEINGFNNLDDIEYRAVNDLFMVYPEHEQYVYVDDLKGSREVENYISSLSASQRGVSVENDATVADAAKHLLG